MTIVQEALSWLTIQALLVGTFVLLLALWIEGWRKCYNMPPGPIQWPIVGSLLSMASVGQDNLLDYFKKLGEKYNGLFTLKMGDHIAVCITDYSIMKEALIKQGDRFSARPPLPIIKALQNSDVIRGVVFRNGRAWKLQKNFVIQSLRDVGVGKKSMDEMIQVEANALISKLEKKEGQPQELKESVEMAVTNIICSLVFGERHDYNDAEFTSLVRALNSIVQAVNLNEPRNVFSLLEYLPYPKSYKILMKGQREIFDLVVKKFDDQRKSMTLGENRDIIDRCLHINIKGGEDSKYFEGEELHNLIFELFLAGADTTTQALTWSLLLMAKYPEYQQKCFTEISTVIGERPPTMADRAILPIVEATISEVLRFRIIAPMGATHITTKDATLRGYHIPKGTWVLLLLHAIMYNEKLWKDPYEFRPDRFLDASGKLVVFDELIPFGIGPRKCPGEALAKTHLFIFFTTLLQKFKILKAEIDVNLDPILRSTWAPKSQNVIFSNR